RRGFDLDLDLAASTRDFGPAAVGQSPLPDIFGMYFQIFFRGKIVDAGGAAGLRTRMIVVQAATSREPDGIFLIDHLGRVTVSDDFEDRFAVEEAIFVQTRR